ncbi:MAG TPA: GntG family PLP-dependent aldolase [Burkholderiales bacterium]|jgi:threonine aldolase|nr:GntG family PLP-dependent aldolase [Burkholderiales bacterium]
MIDLRSDTVTRPTEAMVESMREATFGDDSRDGDATVMKLERLAAERLGKEAAAFMPSGTMANLVAMLTHAQRGGEVLLEQGSHTLNAELGGIAGVAGLFYRGIPGTRGAMDLDALREALRPTLRNQMGTALVWMENSHNRSGGAVLPLEHMKAVQRLAGEHTVPVHLDGARIFNAAAALKREAREIAQHADSACFCVSKGLSAPVGSVLCGTSGFIERARAFRRMVGGNLRQAGPLAAAGIVALETMVDRLAEDHRTAKRLAQGLHRIDRDLVDPAGVETNLVRAELRKSGRRAAEWSARLKDKGILVSPCDAYALRFVTHRHIGDAEVDAAIDALANLWRNR